METIELVFDATARIIERAGALTTNHIAAEAGISVGTLYAYFSNKDAILLEMARRELATTNAAVTAARKSDGDEIIGRGTIRALMRGFGGRNRVRKVLLEAVFAQGRYLELARPVAEVREQIAAPRKRATSARDADPISDVQAFVLTQAVVGVIRAATLEESPLMGTARLEDELVHLTQSYVASVRRRKRALGRV